MKHCINHNHPEIKELAKVLNLPKLVVASQAAIWQEQNTLDRFPTISELTAINLNQPYLEERERFLTNFNKKLIPKTNILAPLGGFLEQTFNEFKEYIKFHTKYQNIDLIYTPVKNGKGDIRVIKKELPKKEPSKNNLGTQGTLFQLNSDVINPAIEELDNYLLNFLKNFNVKSKQFEELKSKLGVDALGATDVLNKLIWYIKNRNEETIPEEAAHMLVALMGENHSDIKELLNNITNWSEYENIKKQYLPIYKDEDKVKIEAVGKLIAKSLVKNYKLNGLDKNKLQKVLDRIMNFIEKILDSINLSDLFMYNQSIADHIAINVLSGNKNYIYEVTNNNSNLNAKKEIDNNPLAKRIINTFSSNNIKMTGSLAIAGTENIRRPEGQGIHDIDFKVKSFDTFDKEVLSKIPDNAVPSHYGWHKKTYSTFAYLIPLEGYRIEVLERKDDFSNGWITDYKLYNEKNEEVEVTQLNVIGVDFFVYKENSNQKDFEFSSEFVPASLVYEGKISLGGKSNPYFFSRDKDQEDYVLRNPKSFIPFEKHIYYQLPTEETNKSQEKEPETSINVQASNFKALEKGTKSISVRTTGKHNYKKGQVLTVKVNGKETETKVRISSIKTVEDFTKLSKLEKDEFARSIGNYIDFEDFLRSDDYISSEKSEVFTDMIDFINGKISGDIIRYSVTQKSIVDQESPYKKQQIYLTRRIKELEKEAESMNKNTTAYDDKIEEIKRKRSKLILLGTSESDYDIYKELGQEYLDEVQDALDSFDDKEPTDEELIYLKELLDIWSDFKGLEKQGKELFERYRVLLSEYTVKKINQYSSKPVTKDDIDANTKDIRSFTMGTGSLLDSPNIIAGTIGRIIRAAQNIINTKDKKLALEIQEEINLLYDYAKKNGAKLDDIYKLFIQEHKGTTKLTTKYFDNKKLNPNYETIQDSPELSRFYNFYQTKMIEFEKNTDNTFGKDFIPNIAKSKLLDGLNPIKTRKVGFSFDQENVSDILETKYNNYLPASEKETNLGEILLKYGMYANNYEKMSSILPEVRLLQEQLTYKINSKGEIIERRFINASDPSTSVLGKDSKIWQQVNQFIDMQVKGNMKNTKQGKYKLLTTKYDKDGNPTEEKYIDVVSIFDTLLKYNSLLRIGLSPITSLSNVIFGDVSNLIEAIGGQFFNIRQLTSASNIFIKQNLDKKSLLNELLLELNPLQELDSYEYMEQVKLTGKSVKMSKEKAQEYIYSMQKSGEKWLQSRTMLAIMIHDGYMTPSGKLTSEGEKMMKSESLKNALTDKIQRLNQVIHGRYTTKEAAIWQQQVIYRLFSQFRKWIPTGIENRFGEKRFDERLQTEVEGRYITLKNLVVNLQDTLARVKEGKLTELEKYNIRKTIAEVTILLATIILFAGLKGGDDDKKRLKNPWVKTSLTLLNRAAGDIGYFFNPKSGVEILKNVVPVAKTLEGLLKVVEYLPYSMYLGDYEIKQGSFKGDNKFYSQVQKQIPVIKSVKDIMRLASNSSLEELR